MESYAQEVSDADQVVACSQSGRVRIMITVDPLADEPPDPAPQVTLDVEHELLVAGARELERVLAADVAEAVAHLLAEVGPGQQLDPDQAAAVRDVLAGLEATLAGFTARGDALRERVTGMQLPTPPAPFAPTARAE